MAEERFREQRRVWALKSGQVEFKSRLRGVLTLTGCFHVGPVASLEELTCHTLNMSLTVLDLGFLMGKRGDSPASFMSRQVHYTFSVLVSVPLPSTPTHTLFGPLPHGWQPAHSIPFSPLTFVRAGCLV